MLKGFAIFLELFCYLLILYILAGFVWLLDIAMILCLVPCGLSSFMDHLLILLLALVSISICCL